MRCRIPEERKPQLLRLIHYLALPNQGLNEYFVLKPYVATHTHIKSLTTVGATSKVRMATSNGTKIKQDRQYTHKVTFSHVRAKTVAVEKQ